MKAKEMKEIVQYLAGMSIQINDIVNTMKRCGELDYSHLTKVYKRYGWDKKQGYPEMIVQEFIEWFGARI